jgi:chromosome segregation ATPase
MFEDNLREEIFELARERARLEERIRSLETEVGLKEKENYSLRIRLKELELALAKIEALISLGED